jgi:hypothetical protein
MRVSFKDTSLFPVACMPVLGGTISGVEENATAVVGTCGSISNHLADPAVDLRPRS